MYDDEDLEPYYEQASMDGCAIVAFIMLLLVVSPYIYWGVNALL